MAGAAILRVLTLPFQRYNAALERSPLVTKSVTSGIMYSAGDLIAQWGEHYNSQKPKPEAERTAFKIDWRRAGIFAIYGTFIAGPLYHAWFNNLDKLPAAMYLLRQHRHRSEVMKAYATLTRHGVKVDMKLDLLPQVPKFHKYTEKAMKIVADQLIFSSLYTLLFFLSVGAMTGAADKFEADNRRHSMEEAHALIRSRYSKKEKSLEADLLRLKSKLHAGSAEREAAAAELSSIDRVLALLKEEEERTHITWDKIWHNTWDHTMAVYWETYVADCIVWPPLQFVNFTFVPLRYQVLYVNACNLGWNTFLSVMANKKH